VRLFALVGVLLVTGGVFLLVDGLIKVQRCISTDVISVRIWAREFWLLDPGLVEAGLGPNAHWFIRAVGAVLALVIGGKVLRIATR
jgi:hypothetical protein